MLKYIAYCRKSTDEKDRQILSIESQIQEIRDFAVRQHLEIIDFVTEAKTAKIPGRPIFEQVVKRIERGEAQGIVSWHPDRLARNSIDGGKIIYLLDTNKLLDLKFPSFWFENSPQGKFVLNIAFGQSKYYVDNLSENVRRGLKQLLRNGVWPAKPPYGYIYNKQAKRVEIDPVMSQVAKQAFELYASGQTQTDVSHFLFTKSISKKSGSELSLNEVLRFLTNPFYISRFKYNGEWYAGSHDLFIDKSLFGQVQHKILDHRPNSIKRKFPFTKLIKCGVCGASITAEHKTKFYRHTRGKVEYIYYRCTKKMGECRQPFIPESLLDAQLRDVAAHAHLPESWADKWHKWLDRDESEEKIAAAGKILILQDDVKITDTKLNTLLDGYLDGTVEGEVYKLKKNELFETKVKLQAEITKLQAQGSSWLGPMREFIEMAKNGDKIARAKNNGEELAVFARNIGLDYFLTNRQLRVRYKRGFRWLSRGLPAQIPAGDPALHSLSELVFEKVRTDFRNSS